TNAPPTLAGPQVQNTAQVVPGKTPEPSEALSSPEVSAEDGTSQETKDSRASTEKDKKQSPSETKTKSKGPEQPSEDGVVEQDGQDTTTPELVKNAVTDSPEVTTVSSIPTNDSGVTKSKASEGDEEEEEEDQEADTGVTHGMAAHGQEQPSLPSSTEEASNRTELKRTKTPGDSDGSTAVSHTTSPLLLIVVAAAAAAVVAA
ncbi:mucin-associated surface protein (MASP), putative, partial [Trypanosoma cruzi marinkellei]